MRYNYGNFTHSSVAGSAFPRSPPVNGLTSFGSSESLMVNEDAHQPPADSLSAEGQTPQTQTMLATLHTAANQLSLSPTRPAPLRPKWHTGIRSKSNPREILLEIYSSLKKLGIEWSNVAVDTRRSSIPSGSANSLNTSLLGSGDDDTHENDALDPYRIDARVRIPNASSPGNDFSTWALHFEVVLYKLSDKPTGDSHQRSMTSRVYARGGYLLDFSNRGISPVASGSRHGSSDTMKPSIMASTVLFLDACAKILTELAVKT